MRRQLSGVALAAILACACGKGGPNAGGQGQQGQGQGQGQAQGQAQGQGQGQGQGQSPEQAAPPAAQTATVTDPNRPFGDDSVAWLDHQFELEMPRSTAPKPAELPWIDVTPAAAPQNTDRDVRSARPEPVKQWQGPVVLAGRRQVFVGNTAVGPVQCSAASPDMCSEIGLRSSTGKQKLQLAGDTAGKAAAELVKAGAAGKPVWLLCDRRLGAQAVLQLVAAIEQAGGQAVLGTATLAGEVARVLPQPGAPQSLAAPPTATEAGAGPVPADLAGVVVRVTGIGVHLELERPPPHPPATPELLGNVAEALSVWAERTRTAAPGLNRAQIVAAADAPWEEVVRVADALRDTCARTAKGTPCHDQRPLYGQIDLSIDASAAGH